MGYDTDFAGQVAVVPPLNPHEVEYLDRFAETRHEFRSVGPYAVNGSGLGAADVYGGEKPPPELPGYWCQWVPTAAGDALIWNGEEKFYAAEHWLAYLIDTFLGPGASIRAEPVPEWYRPPVFEHFTCDHVLNGTVSAKGGEEDDRWRIEVRDNVVNVIRLVEWPAPAEIDSRDQGEWEQAQWAAFVARARHNHVSVISGTGERVDLGPAAEHGFAPIEPAG